jgi:hypothetical protein
MQQNHQEIVGCCNKILNILKKIDTGLLRCCSYDPFDNSNKSNEERYNNNICCKDDYCKFNKCLCPGIALCLQNTTLASVLIAITSVVCGFVGYGAYSIYSYCANQTINCCCKLMGNFVLVACSFLCCKIICNSCCKD